MPIFRKGSRFNVALPINSQKMHIAATVGDPVSMDSPEWKWLATTTPNAYYQHLLPPFQVELGNYGPGDQFTATEEVSSNDFDAGMAKLGWSSILLAVDVIHGKALVALVSHSKKKVKFIEPKQVFDDGSYDDQARRQLLEQVKQHRSLSVTGKGRGGVPKKGGMAKKGKGRRSNSDNKGMDEIDAGDILRMRVGHSNIVALVYKAQKRQPSGLQPYALTVTNATGKVPTKKIFYYLVVNWNTGEGFLVLSKKRPLPRLAGDESKNYKNVGQVTSFSDTGSVATVPKPEKSILFRNGRSAPSDFWGSGAAEKYTDDVLSDGDDSDSDDDDMSDSDDDTPVPTLASRSDRNKKDKKKKDKKKKDKKKKDKKKKDKKKNDKKKNDKKKKDKKKKNSSMF